MRLWSLHSKYLDVRGLVAVWREALLAQAVLAGKTKGYRKHPQLDRFRCQTDPEGAIAEYLRGVYEEAKQRGYNFDSSRISPAGFSGKIEVRSGQLIYELEHLRSKVKRRAPQWETILNSVDIPMPHPLFQTVPGEIEAWEKVE